MKVFKDEILNLNQNKGNKHNRRNYPQQQNEIQQIKNQFNKSPVIVNESPSSKTTEELSNFTRSTCPIIEANSTLGIGNWARRNLAEAEVN